jgi:hypothetical protein
MVLKFSLKVYSPVAKRSLNYSGGLRNLITNNGLINTEEGDKTIEQMVREQWINSEWLDFIAWFHKKEWGLFRKKMLFRGLLKYSFGDLRRVLKLGNDRKLNPDHSQRTQHNELIKEKYGLDPEDFIWAGNLVAAWGIIVDKSTSNRKFLLIYNQKLLESLEGYDDQVWKLKKGVKSFKEALLAVVIVDFEVK